MILFDKYFPDGLKPPPRWEFINSSTPTGRGKAQVIEPLAGRLVVFLSEEPIGMGLFGAPMSGSIVVPPGGRYRCLKWLNLGGCPKSWKLSG